MIGATLPAGMLPLIVVVGAAHFIGKCIRAAKGDKGEKKDVFDILFGVSMLIVIFGSLYALAHVAPWAPWALIVGSVVIVMIVDYVSHNK
jgi:fatty acid desaturase